MKTLSLVATLVLLAPVGSQAADYSGGIAPGAYQVFAGGACYGHSWKRGCCERECSHCDHLWDNYCHEGHGLNLFQPGHCDCASSSGCCPIPSPQHWMPKLPQCKMPQCKMPQCKLPSACALGCGSGCCACDDICWPHEALFGWLHCGLNHDHCLAPQHHWHPFRSGYKWMDRHFGREACMCVGAMNCCSKACCGDSACGGQCSDGTAQIVPQTPHEAVPAEQESELELPPPPDAPPAPPMENDRTALHQWLPRIGF